jgi:hypothetical protein
MMHAYPTIFLCCLFFNTESSTASGLFFTYLALYLMDGHGQPALLYLVPCTLGNKLCYLAFGRLLVCKVKGFFFFFFFIHARKFPLWLI